MWYNVDWSALGQWLLPSWWRKPRLVVFLNVLLQPIVHLYNRFIAERSRIVYEMSFTGQTMSLEAALNDRFDNVDRGIYIENQADPTLLFIHRKEELADSVYIYRKWSNATAYAVGTFAQYGSKVWKCEVANTNSVPAEGNANWSLHTIPGQVVPMILRRKEASQLAWDFIVFVPGAVVFNEDEMRSLINRYRMASKRYKIETY